MNNTEDEAVRDMETTTTALMGSKLGASAKAKDPSGALAVARIFLEWFPKFTDCYQEYIRASQHFPTLLNSFLDQQSSFRQRVTQTGEQAVRSILIEPVQRLPRYSLLIDQITNPTSPTDYEIWWRAGRWTCSLRDA
ncbi:Guanine nucleotide exchange factor VAV2 like protein [Verticillium longisporum]|nr:Guanine nucleotide exchange factor VAV2 like protein [Verticillium longisporum]